MYIFGRLIQVQVTKPWYLKFIKMLSFYLMNNVVGATVLVYA